MKKTLLMGSVALAAFAFTACSGGSTEAKKDTEKTDKQGTEEMAEATYSVNTDASNIRWEGSTAGIQVYSHYGDLSISEGSISAKGDMITSGSFTVDMTSINPKDSNYSEEHPASDLVGHLTTGDFFLVDSFPTASFVVTGHEGDKLMGDLTIRGNTNPETVMIESMEVSDNGLSAKGTLVFDRQKYDVAWEHYMKDVTLSDDIELDITLQASK
jgi:polyisoprenoid-binding protein YceI